MHSYGWPRGLCQLIVIGSLFLGVASLSPAVAQTRPLSPSPGGQAGTNPPLPKPSQLSPLSPTTPGATVQPPTASGALPTPQDAA